LPKIARWNALITPDRQQDFAESHPELIFASRWRNATVRSIRQPASRRGRSFVRHGFDALDQWLGQLGHKDAKSDIFSMPRLELAAQELCTAENGRADLEPHAKGAHGYRF